MPVGMYSPPPGGIPQDGGAPLTNTPTAPKPAPANETPAQLLADSLAATLEGLDPNADYGAGLKGDLVALAVTLFPELPPGDQNKLTKWLSTLTAAPTPSGDPTNSGSGANLNILSLPQLVHLVASLHSSHTTPEHAYNALTMLLDSGTTLTPGQKDSFKKLGDLIAKKAKDGSDPQTLADLTSDDPAVVEAALEKLYKESNPDGSGEDISQLLFGANDDNDDHGMAGRLAGVNESLEFSGIDATDDVGAIDGTGATAGVNPAGATPSPDGTDPTTNITSGVVILPTPPRHNPYEDAGFAVILQKILGQIQQIEQQNIKLGAILLIALMKATLEMAEQSREDAIQAGNLQADQSRLDAAQERFQGAMDILSGVLSIVSAIAVFGVAKYQEGKVEDREKDFYLDKYGAKCDKNAPGAIFDQGSYTKSKLAAGEEVRSLGGAASQSASKMIDGSVLLAAATKDDTKASKIAQAAQFTGDQALIDKLIQTLQQSISALHDDKSAVQFLQQILDLAKSYQQLSTQLWSK